VAIHIHAGDCAFAHADGGSAVAGDHAAEKLKHVGVVADYEDAFAVRVFGEHLLEVGVVGAEVECRADFDFGFVAKLRADKLGGLEGALERAGDDDVDLHLERREKPRHEHALLFSLFDEGSFAIKDVIFASQACIGVPHQVKVHRISIFGVR